MVPLPTNNQNQTTIPSQTKILEIPIFLPAIAYFYLTFNSISIIYQAYMHGDFCMAAFMVFVYLGYFCLMYCITQFQALPPEENSPRKDFLKSVIWVLTNVFLFGFAYQLSTFIHPVAAVFVFAISISASSFLFFLYFVYDPQQQQKQSRSTTASTRYRLRIKILRISSPSRKVISDRDSEMSQVVPGPENV
ncbi:hypothetical protein REPUB_Repub10bG0042700 [Reevesia pubescens]